MLGAALGVVLAVGLVGGCLSPAKPTESPSGPREDYGADGSSIDTTGMTEAEAEQAAKVAAAQKVLQKVKDRDPEEEKKKMARSRAISAEARTKLGKRAYDDAVQTARQALKVHEQNVDAMLVIAQVYYTQGKYELTRAVASSALQVDAKIRSPEDTSRAYNLQGFAMLAMGEDNAATQSFKKAAEADEKNAAAWNNLGTRYLDAGDVTTATACFKYAIELDPRFFKAQLNYGASLRAEGKWQEAEAAMRKSLELRPSYAEAYFNLGVLYLDADPFPGLDTTQRLNKAIQHLGKYRELAASDGSAQPGTSSGLGAEGSAKAPPPRVSKERADDYIRVAKKGLERETRRLEREKGRTAEPASAGAGAATEVEPASAGDATPTKGSDAEPIDDAASDAGSPTPSEPAPQGPSKPTPTGPSKPTPTGPSKPTPSEPTPQGPSKPTPSEPSPQGPSKPAPQGPAPQGPSKPAPQGPAPQGPSKPAPQGPAPQGPAPQGPSKPAPQGPAPQGPSKPAPQGPAPQGPSVQKPQSASWSGPAAKKVLNKPASRGTRWAVPTLISMQASASASPCVDLVLVSPTDARGVPQGIDCAHDQRSHAPTPALARAGSLRLAPFALG
ncbi:MAG: tetratricopeptide repeat protein [Myxococcales bacterium]|nr:tetratricopeptide repeat protein [Myxococcales bacterium]